MTFAEAATFCRLSAPAHVAAARRDPGWQAL